MTLWQKIKADFAERFINYKTAESVYLIPYGLIVCYVSIFYQQYVIGVVGFGYGWLQFSRGIRQFLVNPVKLELKKKILVGKRINRAKGL